MNRIEKLKDSQKLTDILVLLQSLKKQLGEFMRDDFNRSLPFNDLLFDRWQRAEELGFGKGASIYDSAYVFGNVKVGNDTWIGPNTILDGSGNLNIGNNCSISAGVQIYTHDSVNWAISGGIMPYEYAATTIGDNCYVGPNCIITKGVTIGSNSIIGANSFVNKSFPAYSKIAGTPANKLLKK